MKTIQLMSIGLFSLMSFSAFADTPQSARESTIALQVQADTQTNPYNTAQMDKTSENATGLKFNKGSTSVQLYGTVDIGYEHWSVK